MTLCSSLAGTLFVVLSVLKILNFLDWSWWWVTAPLWGSLLLFFLVLGFMLFCGILILMYKRK